MRTHTPVLSTFPDSQTLNLQSSIQLLRHAGILQLLSSIQQVKQNIGNDDRLRYQAQFLYYLWEMLEEEQIQCLEIKEIVKLLSSGMDKNQVRFGLMERYEDEDKVEQFVRAWVVLCANRQYCKYTANGGQRASSAVNRNLQNNKQNNNHKQYPKNASELNQSAQLGSPIKYATRKHNNSRNTLAQTTQLFHPNNTNNQFAYTCQLSVSQERELVSRLYNVDRYRSREEQKRELDMTRQMEELRECTFKPRIRGRGVSVGLGARREIKGYDKAIQRLKAGNEKNKISKEMREYNPVGANYEKLKQKGINPPKFLNRKKQQRKVLFIISFDLGRHQTNVKIRQGDTQDSVAQKLCRIYSLKQQFYNQIKEVVKQQLDIYYSEQLMEEQTQGQTEGQEQLF